MGRVLRGECRVGPGLWAGGRGAWSRAPRTGAFAPMVVLPALHDGRHRHLTCVRDHQAVTVHVIVTARAGVMRYACRSWKLIRSRPLRQATPHWNHYPWNPC
ncbi:hypothetical protein STRIP9103_06854 [Streptomyces ipomoeae 91-03]|uniref:Uncharacterized protein n=1 Tax=Streptomyces ipomoeae 91-03 TaxID=698759 RepID=L1KZR3_9ACTN|nr:hypothetical protein STRIP9103_06854 [Streptomyces ipomoeae 91-03]